MNMLKKILMIIVFFWGLNLSSKDNNSDLTNSFAFFSKTARGFWVNNNYPIALVQYEIFPEFFISVRLTHFVLESKNRLDFYGDFFQSMEKYFYPTDYLHYIGAFNFSFIFDITSQNRIAMWKFSRATSYNDFIPSYTYFDKENNILYGIDRHNLNYENNKFSIYSFFDPKEKNENIELNLDFIRNNWTPVYTFSKDNNYLTLDSDAWLSDLKGYELYKKDILSSKLDNSYYKALERYANSNDPDNYQRDYLNKCIFLRNLLRGNWNKDGVSVQVKSCFNLIAIFNFICGHDMINFNKEDYILLNNNKIANDPNSKTDYYIKTVYFISMTSNNYLVLTKVNFKIAYLTGKIRQYSQRVLYMGFCCEDDRPQYNSMKFVWVPIRYPADVKLSENNEIYQDIGCLYWYISKDSIIEESYRNGKYEKKILLKR